MRHKVKKQKQKQPTKQQQKLPAKCLLAFQTRLKYEGNEN